MDIKTKVIKKLNAQLGKDLKSLKELEEYYEKIQTDKKAIEEMLSLASSEAPSVVKEALKEACEVTNKIEEINHSCKSLCENIDQRLQKQSKSEDLQELIDNINYLQKANSYLHFIKFIEDLCIELEVSLFSGNDDACLSSYLILKDTCQNLEKSKCTHLKNYAYKTLEYWYNEIKKKLVSEYNETLKTLKWPFSGPDASQQNSYNHETISKFRILTKHLFHLELPEHLKAKPSGLFSIFEPVCLPINLLVHPLKQRFVYHFSGTKQTNRRDKPEWFFTQVLTWIKNHLKWIEEHVQPVAIMTGLKNINTPVEFMRVLVRLAAEKLHSELAIAQYDDSLFAHIVDEALGFERELRDSLCYPAAEPVTVFILTQAQIFTKWIIMEKKFATEKMDAILSSNTAWKKLSGYDFEELKVTECAESFMTMLSTISERYSHLPQPGHRLQFLELQLELIDDWRVRLLQLLHEDYEDPVNSLIPSILNTLNYVINVLVDWGNNILYSNLYFFKKKCESPTNNIQTTTENALDSEFSEVSVFDSAINLLEILQNKLISELTHSIFNKIKAESRTYRNEKWFSMRVDKDPRSLNLTPSACSMFKEISDNLFTLDDLLAKPVFVIVWKNLAKRLDKYLLDQLILKNQFNSHGAIQLQYDIKRNLLPLFNLYTNNPESFFPLLLESCILLNILLGSAILLMETLENESESVISEALADMGIYNLTKKTTIEILKNRIDLCTL